MTRMGTDEGILLWKASVSSVKSVKSVVNFFLIRVTGAFAEVSDRCDCWSRAARNAQKPARTPALHARYLSFEKSARKAFTFFSSVLQQMTPVSLLSW